MTPPCRTSRVPSGESCQASSQNPATSATGSRQSWVESVGWQLFAPRTTVAASGPNWAGPERSATAQGAAAASKTATTESPPEKVTSRNPAMRKAVDRFSYPSHFNAHAKTER